MSVKTGLFLRRWMLLISMSLGVGLSMLLFYVPGLASIEAPWHEFAHRMQPVLVGVMLFLQFNVTAPSDLGLHRWHVRILLLQALLFAVTAAACIALPRGGVPSLLFECAMLCFICPTASASGVITSKIGGSLQQGMAYLLLSDMLATLLIPVIIPLVHPSEVHSYLQRLWIIGQRVFAILVLPCALAWLIRFFLPGLQRWLARYTGWAFYVWGICLMLAMYLATHSLLSSGTSIWTAFLIAAVAMLSCVLQFWLGRSLTRRQGDAERITAGQVLGQKNTGFLIWLGLGFMTPVTSVVGGFYALWQNLINSWELQHTKIIDKH